MPARPLIDRIVCLSSLSKDLKGEFDPLDAEQEECRELECRTLETVHRLDLRATAHACDSEVGKLLDGVLRIGELVHKFEDGDASRRGVHEGAFRWKGEGALAAGTIQGVTNVGTHRAPAFAECQRCDETGVMEGLLVGRIRRARDKRLVGCELRAAYRLRFDVTRSGPAGGTAGTLEGSVICDCPDPA